MVNAESIWWKKTASMLVIEKYELGLQRGIFKLIKDIMYMYFVIPFL